MAVIRVGTRASALALWQTERVRGLLHAAGHQTERIEIRTTGDAILDVPLSQIGSRALFTKQLDDAMLEGRIDLAVHSLKDLPTVLPEGIALGAVAMREDPRDALVTRVPGLDFAHLPHGAVVATSSLRRRAQLRAKRPDLQVVDVRGNVDTRLGKLDAAEGWAAIILASAGLVRLGFDQRITERLQPDVMLPAPGQGALGVTLRVDDLRTRSLLHASLHDRDVGLATAAERGFLRRLEGGCQVPVAALATIAGDRLALHGRVTSLDGSRTSEGRHAAPVRDDAEAAELGQELAERLLQDGAASILAEVRGEGATSGDA